MVKKIKVILFLLTILAIFAFASMVSAAVDCWDYSNNDESTCESAGNGNECTWHEDPWGGWCEQKGCWNLWAQSDCTQTNNASSSSFINKSCSWQSSSSGWCMDLDCWAFDGTNQSACVNNSQNIKCNWIDTYDESNWQYPCMGPPEKQCWSLSTQTTCEAVSGCTWGVCMKENCWDFSDTNKATCETKTGFNEKSCKWETYSWGSQCVEQGCWNYNNRTGCQSNNCSWEGSYCMDLYCGTFSSKNESYCVNNTANLNCDWDNNGQWCSEKGCWNYDQNTCGNSAGCFWETSSGGWCEEQWCWNWDGQQADCTNSSLHPGLNCVYDNNWCYENVSAKSCSDLSGERDCMDTFYCWWNFSGSTCNDPQEGVSGTEFVEWNPGCYIFDMEQNLCQNTTGCYWNTGDASCDTNTTLIPSGQLNCSFINNMSTCNSIPALSTCCSWQAGQCVGDKFDQSCRDQMQEPPEGAYYCEDYVAYTDKLTCEQIAGSPWLMPCKWNNASERCEFKGDDIFGTGEKNIMKIDNQKNCEAAGGKWILDTYPSTNNASTAVKLSLGRCDFKFDDERNCDKECFACDFKTDKTNWESNKKAKEACIESKLGICKFTEDSAAPNNYGYCEPKDEFKQGMIGGDCDSDCGSCTYMGDATASSGYKPSDYCTASKAKCKWVADPSNPDDEAYGRCVSKSEKTCEDKCDKCYDESSCKNTGGKKGDSNAAGVCEWGNGVCTYKSGASEMEICWDGTDNNGDNKIDCADSMCWSDPFCGGDLMFTNFGTDCFTYDDDSAGCAAAGCSYINETWGAWCDMPGAVCWKKDGTNQSYCESDSANNDTCEWHSGFGGFCEQDWDMGGAANSCFNAENKTECNALANQNCTWVIDTWCQDKGGWCEGNPSYTGTEWQECWQYDSGGNETCEAAVDSSGIKTCRWQKDAWCEQQGADAGFCDHKSFACWQYNTSTCENANNSAWCMWKTDQYSPEGGWCEGKMMGGGSGSCWDNTNDTACAAAGCNWMSGFCDPKGFGGDFMPGMPGGGGMGGGSGSGMGGFGMQCFMSDGNQTACTNQTGCGWFDEPWPFCDINFESNCPQYTYNQTSCNNQANCKWNPQGNFCDEKLFECFWNMTLQSDPFKCDEHPLCFNDNGNCNPVCFNSNTEAACSTAGSGLCRWMTGWCNPAMAAQFFGGMEMSGPPIPLGDDPDDAGISDEVDILNFGLKDMGNAFGYGITVDDPKDSAACNDQMMSSGKGVGTNTTKFYWYLDTDGNTTNNCNLQHNSSLGGYEFYIKNEWSYDSSSGSVNENPAAYRCSSGSWLLAEIRVSSERRLMCDKIGGAMVGIEKTELEKFPALYTPGIDVRVAVTSADVNGNITNPSDIANPGWMTPGSIDFDIDDLNLYGYETDITKKAKKEGAGAGFIEYGKDADCWTAEGCQDYSCKDHAYCVENQLGVESGSWTDTRVPKIVGIIKESYPDSAFFAYFTDKPANGSLKFYGNDSSCASTSLNATVYDSGVTSSNVREYRLWHLAKIYDGTIGYSLKNTTAYYFKLKVCDDSGKCGESKCSSFVTETNANCPFCKFVSRIKAPSGWNVYYDLDQDGGYEHWQGNILGSNDGMFTNYTSGRLANLKLNTTDGTAHIEFINITLTKSGMGPKIRDIQNSTALKDGTTTDASGDTIGYVGMIDETRDKIIYNLYPELCKVKIPGTGTCDELWHCNDNGTNCVNRTSEATLINTTSSSCFWEIPYCEFSTWAGGQPATPITSSSSSSSSGGGGGGGGGGAGASYPQSVHYFDLIIKGETKIMDINNSAIVFTEGAFVANKDLEKVTIKILKIENASEVPQNIANVYQYLEIKLFSILDNDIKKATLKFKVENSWLTSNNYEDAVLMRYSDGKWNSLKTSRTGSDNDYIYYTAESPGFSYFSVVGKKPKEALIQEVEEPAKESPAAQTQQQSQQPPITGAAVIETEGKGINKFLVGIASFVILGIVILYIILKIKKPPVNAKKPIKRLKTRGRKPAKKTTSRLKEIYR